MNPLRTALAFWVVGSLACDSPSPVEEAMMGAPGVSSHNAAANVHVVGQHAPISFTAEDEYQALRLILPEDEAKRGAVRLPDEPPGHSTPLQPQEYAASGVSYVGDILILLSLVSDELEAKVEMYRQSQRRHAGWGDEEEKRWAARREELKEALGIRPRP